LRRGVAREQRRGATGAAARELVLPSQTTVLVAGGRSPDRTIALALLLREAAGRHGWSDSMTIRCGGLGAAAGRVSDAGVAALRGRGVDAVREVCPDLERRSDLLGNCDWIVCDCAEVADALVDWEQAAGARCLCLDDLAANRDDHEPDREVPIAHDVAAVDALVPEVLRRLIARAPLD